MGQGYIFVDPGEEDLNSGQNRLKSGKPLKYLRDDLIFGFGVPPTWG